MLVPFGTLGNYFALRASCSTRALSPNCRLSATARIAEATHTRPDQYWVSQRLHHSPAALHSAVQTLPGCSNTQSCTPAAAPQRWPAQPTNPKASELKNSQKKCNGSRPTSTARSRTQVGRGKTICSTPYRRGRSGNVRVETARRQNPWSRRRTRRNGSRLVLNVKQQGIARGSAKYKTGRRAGGTSACAPN